MTIRGIKSIEFDGSSFVLELSDISKPDGDTTTMFVADNLPMTITYDKHENIVVTIEH